MTELSINEVALTNERQITNSFNDYFSSVGETLASQFSQQSKFMQYLTIENKPESTFSFTPVTYNELTDTIRSLKSTSSGCHEIPISIFNDNMDILGNTKLHIRVCNNSFS